MPAALPPVIVIDVGHSVTRPGAISATGQPEFQYNLAMARRIAGWMTRLGQTYRMNGDDGRADTLLPRAHAADGQALLLSIHHDSIQSFQMSRAAQYSGFSLHVSYRNPRARETVACAERIGHALLAAGHRPALFHADDVPGEGHVLIDRAIGLYRRDALAVISRSSVPAVLLEVGVITNPVENAWLSRPDVANAIAAVVAKAASGCTR